MTFTLIAAVADNGVIGDSEGIPWHYPRDFKHFRNSTLGAPVIMGRKTYENIVDLNDGPLTGRVNIVLSTTMEAVHHSNVFIVRSLDEAKRFVGDVKSFVVGGEIVYEQFMPIARKLVITEIPETPDGDVLFPDWDDSEWREVQRVSDEGLDFVTYNRLNPIENS